MEYVSNCCQAELLYFHNSEETAICSECNDHCTVVEHFEEHEAFEWLEKNGFQGTDASTEISLMEYDILVKYDDTNEDPEQKVLILYRSRYSENMNQVSEPIIAQTEMTLGELQDKYADLGAMEYGFLSFNGCGNYPEFLSLPVYNQIADILRYYGELDLFGEPTTSRTSNLTQMVGEMNQEWKEVSK